MDDEISTSPSNPNNFPILVEDVQATCATDDEIPSNLDSEVYVEWDCHKDGENKDTRDSGDESQEKSKNLTTFEGAIMKHFEVNGNTLSLALFVDVTNSKELLESMQAATLDPEVAFLNALLIPDVFPLLAAAHKTLVSKSRDSLTTRTLHSELVYNYSGSKHITESLKRCGISETSTYILAARYNATSDEIEQKAVEKLVSGKEIDLEELAGRADEAQIQKHYKITSQELGISSLADAITCRIAARDAL